MLFKSTLLVGIIMGMIFSIRKYDTKWKWLSVVLIPIYLYCVYLFTVSGRVGTVNMREMNLNPGESIFIMLSSPWNNRGMYEFVEVVGNILLFVPLGLILKKYLNCPYYVLAIIAGTISFSIECTQYYFLIGTFEIDDIINNTWGTFIGANMVYLLERLHKKELLVKNYVYEWLAFVMFLLFSIGALIIYLRFVFHGGVIIKP